jgi:flavin-dependent dehydrogenase
MAVPSSGREVDVTILGAGPAGSALALGLKRTGVDQVLLVDRPMRRPFRIGESAAPGLGPLLRRLGLDDRLEGRGHHPCYGNLSSWGRPQLAVEDFMNGACGRGWHLDREAFDDWLRAEAVDGGAELLSPARIEAARREGDGWHAEIRTTGSSFTVKTRWIVDATGRPAIFSACSGARRHRIDRLIALAAVAGPAENSGYAGYSLVEAVEIGWWYAARLPSGAAVVALMTDADLARAASLSVPEVYHRAWETTLEVRRFVPPPREPPRPAICAAGSQFLDRAIGPGWLALGDALIAFDPLSASGITGALEDAIAAVDTLVPLLDEPNSSVGCDLRAVYAKRASATLRRYVVESCAIYGRERRWSESLFWRRRRAET